MKKSLKWLAAALACVVAAAAVAGTVNFTTPGFSIDALDAPVGNQKQLIMEMFLPATEGFAPNVSVMYMPTNVPFEQFVQISRNQLAPMNLTEIHFENHGDGTAVIEYSGTMQRRELHFYQRLCAVRTGVYAATGTTLESQWKDVGAQIAKNVDTLKVGQ